MNFGTLKWFGSFIKKLSKIIGMYQPCDLHLWVCDNFKINNGMTKVDFASICLVGF